MRVPIIVFAVLVATVSGCNGVDGVVRALSYDPSRPATAPASVTFYSSAAPLPQASLGTNADGLTTQPLVTPSPTPTVNQAQCEALLALRRKLVADINQDYALRERNLISSLAASGMLGSGSEESGKEALRRQKAAEIKVVEDTYKADAQNAGCVSP